MADLLSSYGDIITIIMYFAPAVISLVILGFMKKKLIWLSIPITIVADLIAFWDALTNYEFWQLALVFLIPQIIVVTIVSLSIMRFSKKKVLAVE